MKIQFTGISDEGADKLIDQIKLHRELGWNSLELRTIDGKNICDLNEPDFLKVEQILNTEKMKVVGFASSIANWSRSVNGLFDTDKDELLRSAPRMHRLNTEYIRIMSYTQGDASPEEWALESIKRIRELTYIAEGEGITLIHENCDGWGSAEPENLKRLLDEIPSDALKIVFDMGNPRGHGHNIEKVWDFLHACEDRIAHIHIKDCYLNSKGEAVHCLPGEGECQVKPIVEHMVNNKNYSGFLSIEPHMVFQFHEGPAETADADQKKAANYLEYGRKTMDLFSSLAEIRG